MASKALVGTAANSPAVFVFNGGTLTTKNASPALCRLWRSQHDRRKFIMNSGLFTVPGTNANEIDIGGSSNAADGNDSSYGAFLMNGGTGVVHTNWFGFSRGTWPTAAAWPCCR